MMFDFLSGFTHNAARIHTVIVMDEDQMEPPRQYRVRPRNVFLILGGSVLVLALVLVTLLVVTPLRELIPGYGTAEMRRHARLTALRLATLEDSLATQQQYMLQLRNLMMGQVDSTLAAGATAPEPGFSVSGELAEVASSPSSQNWTDHEQPALPIVHMPVEADTPARVVSVSDRYLSSLQFPVLPPVNGLFTRGFDARTGHYAVDIAVQEGTVVRSIGDGHVIFADWTQEGGFALAVQHADGFVSVYKHNQRLLKHVGDRVHDRDAIAVSGNSGEVTTGPHVHFELWHHGLAQDPRYFMIGG